MNDLPFAPYAPAADPWIGRVLEARYRIVRRLGVGGMGVVYEGEHTLIRRRVAIKCLHAAVAHDPAALARFHREALAATAIGNEHITEVTDMGHLPDGVVFLVLEFLDGRELSRALEQDGPFPIARAVHVLAQLCEALAATHARGIVHRDLKPANVFLVARGGDPDFVKVLDFGISKFRGVLDGPQGFTGTGALLGTPLYMAPEQFENTRGVDARADIYALGGIFFRLLTGRTPFFAPELPALIHAVLHAPLPDVRDARPDVPDGLADLVRRMLARDPRARPASCDLVREALAPFTALTAPPHLHPRRPHAPLALALAGSAVVLLAGVGLAAAARDPAPPSLAQRALPSARATHFTRAAGAVAATASVTPPAWEAATMPEAPSLLPEPHARTRPTPDARAAPAPPPGPSSTPAPPPDSGPPPPRPTVAPSSAPAATTPSLVPPPPDIHDPFQ